MSTLNDKHVTQPLLLRVQSAYYVKAYSNAISLGETSSCTDAVEFLFMTFFVFGVHYPAELRNFYGFQEHMLGIKQIAGRSSVLPSLLRILSGMQKAAWLSRPCLDTLY